MRMVWQKQDQATKDFLLMDFMSEAQQFTKQMLLLYVQKVFAAHASELGSAWEEQNIVATQKIR